MCVFLTDEDRPVIITQDNLGAHISADLIEFCMERRLELVTFPANTTHILQPCDALFHSLKSIYTQIGKHAQLASPTGIIAKANFSGI